MSDLLKVLETTPDDEWPIGLDPNTGTLNVVAEDSDEESELEFQDYDPNQPRDPGGEGGGQWIKSGAGAELDYDEIEFDESEGPTYTEMTTMREAAVREPPPLVSGEIKAFENYSSVAYETWNNKLRSGDDISGSGVERMDAVFERAALPQPVTAWRKAGPNTSNRIENMADGTIFEDKGFVSTSLAYERAASFTPAGVDNEGDGGRVFRIDVPKGYRAVPMDGLLSEHDDEKELLLKRGTKFRVRRVSNVVRLEVVP